MRPGEAVAALAAEWKLTASLSQGGPGSRASFQQLGQAPPGAALLPATHLLIHGKRHLFSVRRFASFVPQATLLGPP